MIASGTAGEATIAAGLNRRSRSTSWCLGAGPPAAPPTATVRRVHPNLTVSSAEASLILLEAKGRGSPEAFLLSWDGWDRLKVRVVVVALALPGFPVKDVHSALSDRRVHTLRHSRGLFQSVVGTYTESAKVVRRIWAQLKEFRKVPNRYAHGPRGAAPLGLESGAHLVIEDFLDSLLPDDFAVEGASLAVCLGEPFRRMRPRREGCRGEKGLRGLVDLAQRKA